MKLPNAYPNKNIDVDRLIRFLYQYRNYFVDFNHQQFIYRRDVLYPKFYNQSGEDLYVYAFMTKDSGKLDLRIDSCKFGIEKGDNPGELKYYVNFYFYNVFSTDKPILAIVLYAKNLQHLFSVLKRLWNERADRIFTKWAKAALNNYKLIGENNLGNLALWYKKNDPSVIVGLNENQRIKDLLKFLSSPAFSNKRFSVAEAAILNNLRSYLPSYSYYREKPDSDSTAADRVLKALHENTLVIGQTQSGNVTTPAFKHLYNNMIDNVVGPDNFTEAVHLLYRLWQASSYSNLNNKEYNSYNKQSSLIPYTIKQRYLKSTGMRFQFRSKDIVKQQSQNSKIIETNYHIYQPVLPIDFDKINDEEYQEKLFLIPAFYLKMLDDKIKWENLIKVLFLILDVVTIASGIGILTKLRYLRYLSSADKVFTIFVGTLEISVGSLNILLNIAEEDKYPKFCKKLRTVLLIVELSSAMMAEAIIKPALKRYATEALEEFGRLNRYLQETEEMARAKQQLEAIVTPERYPAGIPEKIGDDLYMLRKNGDEVFRGTKKEVDELVERLKKMPDTDAKKYLDDLVESRKLDDYINGQGYKFTKLGYRFTHSMKKSKDGVIDVTMFLIDKNGQKLIQGFSNINKGVLDNVFEVSIQQHEVSTAMYKLLDKIGFNKVVGNYYGNSTLNVNYIEFMKVFKTTNDKVKAALSTPAGKALNNSLDNKFLPEVTKIDDINKKITINWTKI